MARLLPHLDRDLTDLPGEEWRDAYGFDGLYQASNLGRVKSLSRLSCIGRRIRVKIRSQFMSGKNSGMWVRLFVDGNTRDVSIGPLVLRSFGIHPDCPDHVAMHRNKSGFDNSLDNLCFVSQGESVQRNWQMGLSAWSENASDWRNTERATYTAQYVAYEGDSMRITCIRCGAEHPASDYDVPNRSRRRNCNHCAAVTNRIKQTGLARYKQNLREQGLKECTGCQQVKPLADFYKRLDFQTSRCKVCTDANRGRRNRAD